MSMSAIELVTIIGSMLGGLALFLVGMGNMTSSLSAMTGGTLNHMIEKVTKNRFASFLFGAGLTALVQSVSATSVLTVGLVNSGMIEFSKAISLIIGANLGTTSNAWILSLNAVDGESFLMTVIKPSFFAPFVAIIGVALTMFAHSEKKKNIGSALLGFSIMMIGMSLMSSAVAPLKEIPAITNLLMSFTNPILGFLFACGFALLIQSSDATIGIVLAFAHSIGVTYGMAIPLICGAQVGTCITAIISSIGRSNNGKRTALLNLYYNLFKTLSFMAVFYLLNSIFHFSLLGQDVGAIGIPLFHTFINLCGCAVWMPLSFVIVNLAQRTIPLSEQEKQEQANTLTMLDENFLATPGIAIEQADKAVVLLSETVGEAFLTIVAIRENPELSEQAQLLCERSQQYKEQISAYLVELRSRKIGEKGSASVTLISTGNNVFGGMGKIAERLLGMVNEISESFDQLTEADRMDIHVLGEAISEIMQLTIRGYNFRKPGVSRTIRYYMEEVMDLGDIVKKRFIKRIHEEERPRTAGTLFTDICYAEEQLIDYCDLIAEALIRYDEELGESTPLSSESTELNRSQIHEIFRDMFAILER